jgi:hypothetical protein
LRLRSHSWLVAAATTTAFAITAASASANTYTVFSCKGPTGVANAAAGWLAQPSATGDGAAVNSCASSGPLSAVLNAAQPASGASASWRFEAPANTRVVRFAAQRRTTGAGAAGTRFPSDVQYILQTDTQTLESCVVSDTSPCVNDLSGAIDKQGIDAAYVLFRVICTNAGAQCSRPLRVDYDSARVGLADAAPPTVSGVRVIDSGDTSGVLTVGFNAADNGGGVYRAVISVDGKAVATQPMGGGDCTDANPTDADPYEFLTPVPCPATVSGAVVKVNYRSLTAGPHSVTISVEDAAGNTTSVLGPVQFPRLNAENQPSSPAGINRLLHAKLKMYFAKGRHKTFTSRYGERVVTRGILRDSKGKPIRGARIDVFHRLRSKGHLRLLKTGLKTRKDGRLTLILPLNVDTRSIEFDFRALRPGKITSRQILRLTVHRNGRTFIRKLRAKT